MFYIGIEKLRKVCYIGLFEEEKKIPNTLEFDMKVGKRAATISEIGYEDYSVLSQIITKVLNSEKHHDLLEDVLKKIIEEIKKNIEYDFLFIRIKKIHPPTNEYMNASFIEWEENN